MAILFVVAALLLVLHHHHLCVAFSFVNTLYRRSRDVWHTDCCVSTVINKKNLIEYDFITGFKFAFHFLDFYFVTNGYAILLAPGCYNCKFHIG